MPALATATQPTAQHCCPTCGGELRDQFSWDADTGTFIANGAAVCFRGVPAKMIDALWRHRFRGGIPDLSRFMECVYSDDPSGGPELNTIISVYLIRIRKRLEPTGYTVTYNMGNPRAGYRLIKIEEAAR